MSNPETALAPVEQAGAMLAPSDSPTPASYADGMIALASLSDDQFNARVEMLLRGRKRIQILQRTLLEKGVDWGEIPGVSKPCLMKAGAETLCRIYNLVPEFRHEIKWGDGVEDPAVTVISECHMHSGCMTAPVIGSGAGAATSWERKYRWRRAGRTCPSCGAKDSISRSTFADRDRPNDPKGWYCNKRNGGCGANFRHNDRGILDQNTGEVPNPDQHDLLNTILKMADKRALVQAVLLTTGTSSVFTQDVEEGGAVAAIAGASDPWVNPAIEPRSPNDALRIEVEQPQPRPSAPVSVPVSTPPQRPAPPSRPAAPSAPAGKPRVVNSTGAKCPSCHAPDGSAHTRTCSAAQQAVPDPPARHNGDPYHDPSSMEFQKPSTPDGSEPDPFDDGEDAFGGEGLDRLATTTVPGAFR